MDKRLKRFNDAFYEIIDDLYLKYPKIKNKITITLSDNGSGNYRSIYYTISFKVSKKIKNINMNPCFNTVVLESGFKKPNILILRDPKTNIVYNSPKIFSVEFLINEFTKFNKRINNYIKIINELSENYDLSFLDKIYDEAPIIYFDNLKIRFMFNQNCCNYYFNDKSIKFTYKTTVQDIMNIITKYKIKSLEHNLLIWKNFIEEMEGFKPKNKMKNV